MNSFLTMRFNSAILLTVCITVNALSPGLFGQRKAFHLPGRIERPSAQKERHWLGQKIRRKVKNSVIALTFASLAFHEPRRVDATTVEVSEPNSVVEQETDSQQISSESRSNAIPIAAAVLVVTGAGVAGSRYVMKRPDSKKKALFDEIFSFKSKRGEGAPPQEMISVPELEVMNETVEKVPIVEDSPTVEESKKISNGDDELVKEKEKKRIADLLEQVKVAEKRALAATPPTFKSKSSIDPTVLASEQKAEEARSRLLNRSGISLSRSPPSESKAEPEMEGSPELSSVNATVSTTESLAQNKLTTESEIRDDTTVVTYVKGEQNNETQMDVLVEEEIITSAVDGEVELEELKIEEARIEEAPIEEASIKEAPIEGAPIEEAPIEEAPIEEVPIEEAPIEEAPIEEVPIEEVPIEEVPFEEVPIEEVPIEEAPIEEAPIEEVPIEEAPIEEAPIEEAPIEEAPIEEAPIEEVPIEEALIEEVPIEEALIEEVPIEEAKALNDQVEEAAVDETILEEATAADAQSEQTYEAQGEQANALKSLFEEASAGETTAGETTAKEEESEEPQIEESQVVESKVEEAAVEEPQGETIVEEAKVEEADASDANLAKESLQADALEEVRVIDAKQEDLQVKEEVKAEDVEEDSGLKESESFVTRVDSTGSSKKIDVEDEANTVSDNEAPPLNEHSQSVTVAQDSPMALSVDSAQTESEPDPASFTRLEKERISNAVFECHGFFPDLRGEEDLPPEVAMARKPKSPAELQRLKEKYSSIVDESERVYTMLIDLGMMENYDHLGPYTDDFDDYDL